MSQQDKEALGIQIYPGRRFSSILSELEKEGFIFSYATRNMPNQQKSMGVIRPSYVDGIFEELQLMCHLNGIMTRVFASIVPTGNSFAGMCDSYHDQLSSDSDADIPEWLELKSKEQCQRFEHCLTRMPQIAAQFAREHGAEILKRTQKAREAAKFYYCQFEFRDENLELTYYRLKAETTDRQKELAKAM